MKASGRQSDPNVGAGNQVVLVRDPRRRVGGVESWVEALARGLPREGVPVTILVPCRRNERRIFGQQARGAAVVGIPCREDAAEQAREVVEALGWLAGMGASGVFFTMYYRYVNIAGLNLRGSPWLPLPVMHGWHRSSYDWMCLGPPRKIVAPTVELARECRGELRKRVGCLRACGTIVTIPHGVPLPDPQAIDAKAKRAVREPLRLVAASRLNEDTKRPWDLVTIAAALKEAGLCFEFVILGDGPCLEQMREKVVSLRLDGIVRMPGAVARNEVYRTLLESDVFVATSESEAFGLAIAEALACACTVVTSDLRGAVTEMVENGVTGFRVPVGDIARYVDAVQALFEDRARLRAMGAAGHRLVREKFSEERMVGDYARLCRSLKTTGPRPEWTRPGRLAVSPGQAVGPGLASRFGLGSVVRLIRASRRR